MLSNFDLENYAKEHDLDLIGVFSKDQMPKKKICGSYIINMQDLNDGNGTHWIACKIFENKKCCYFDSFGCFAPEETMEFLKPFKPVATNNREIQNIKSIKCGYFCLAFIKFFNNFNTKKYDVFEAYDDFLNSFSNNTKTNDSIVMEMLKK